jgi:hypothetical protein
MQNDKQMIAGLGTWHLVVWLDFWVSKPRGGEVNGILFLK